MRVLRTALTHIFCDPRTFYPRFVPSLSLNSSTSRMASNSSDWSAQRVRHTFLEYFQKNGHTFGECLTSNLAKNPLHPPPHHHMDDTDKNLHV